MKIGSLFSGAGGLDMAAEQVFDARTVWHCELDPAASKVLAHRWPDVPNLGDITAVDWSTVEPIDVLCGGFPCQDVSSAGRQAGMGEGTRSGLWSEFARAIAALRPRLVVIENVRNLLSVSANRHVESEADALGDSGTQPVLRGLGAVLGDLADLGYDAQWVTVSAASVGAPHKRERVFILATDANADNAAADGQWTREEPREGGSDVADAARDGWPRLDDSTGSASACGGRIRLAARGIGRPPVADTAGDGRHEGRPESAGLVGRSNAAERGHGHVDLLPTPSVADSEGGHATRSGARSNELLLPGVARAYGNGDLLPTPSAQDGNGGGRFNSDGHQSTLPGTVRESNSWGKYAPAVIRWETVTRPAPSPTEPNSHGKPRLAPAFPEWMMGWPDGWVTALIALKLISRNDALRIIGNGVCPQQAYAAIRMLLRISVFEVAA